MIFFIWFVFINISVKAWLKPLGYEEIVKENEYSCSTNYAYVVEVTPSSFYPEGGLISGEEGYLTAITLLCLPDNRFDVHFMG
jgi:hypothetical protein